MDLIINLSSSILWGGSLWVIHDLAKRFLYILYNKKVEIINEIINEHVNEHVNENTDMEESESKETERVIYCILNMIPERMSSDHSLNNFIHSIEQDLNRTKPRKISIPDNIDLSDVPDELKCPISKELMIDPVQSADGHTYEREMIERHMKS